MPKITKQTTQRRRPQSGIVDAIVSVADMPTTGIKMCVYGRGKTGKTTFACTFPKPMLLIGTEDGTKSVRGIKGLDFVRLDRTANVEPLADLVGQKYKSVAIDTAGGLQDMILKEILGLDDIPIEKSWGMAVRDQWQACGVQTKERLRALLDLADSRGVNVVVIAHERNFNDEGGSDLIFPTVGAALTPSAAGWLNGACDYLCQTYLREQTTQKALKVGGKASTVMQRTGRVEYCLRVGPHPVFMTGFRVTRGIVVPEAIVDPDYEKIVAVISGKQGRP